jgi:hypothetical protein
MGTPWFNPVHLALRAFLVSFQTPILTGAVKVSTAFLFCAHKKDHGNTSIDRKQATMNSFNNNHNVTMTENTTGVEKLESKLQTVAATFRRERDEAHRSKELAFERLRLAEQDANASKQGLIALQTKFDMLQKESGDDADREIQQLQNDVKLLTKQVRVCVV